MQQSGATAGALQHYETAVGAGREGMIRSILDAQVPAMRGSGDNALFTAEVGVAVIEALGAFGRHD